MKYIISAYPELDTTLALIGSLIRHHRTPIVILYKETKDIDYLTDWINHDLGSDVLENGTLKFEPSKKYAYDRKSEFLIEPKTCPDYKSLEKILTTRHGPTNRNPMDN